MPWKGFNFFPKFQPEAYRKYYGHTLNQTSEEAMEDLYNNLMSFDVFYETLNVVDINEAAKYDVSLYDYIIVLLLLFPST